MQQKSIKNLNDRSDIFENKLFNYALFTVSNWKLFDYDKQN